MLGGEVGLLHSAVAALLCVVPTAVTQVWAERSLGKPAEHQLAAVLGGTGIRMVFVVGIGMALFFSVPAFAAAGFWLWTVVFYLATLGLETFLVVRSAAAMDKSSAANPPL